MNNEDRDLGMNRKITRRDFLDGAGIAVAAATMVSASSQAGAASPAVGSGDANYPPGIQGMRGQNDAALQYAHALRDGAAIPAPEDTKETYDLVVVGAGMSGLAAACFYRKFFGHAKVLVLDNCDDFGGHARRNEMTVNGHQVLAPAGTIGITDWNSFHPAARDLLNDIGIDPDRFIATVANDVTQYAKMGLRNGAFFDKETFGVDRLVVGHPLGMSGFASADKPMDLAEFVDKAPLSAAVRASLLERQNTTKDYFPGLSREEKIARLRKMSYAAYMTDVMKLDPGIIKVIYRLDTSSVNGSCGMDSYSAHAAFRRGLPGFGGLDLGPRPPGSWTAGQGPSKGVRFPDGNGGVARLMVRFLIPDALPGTTMEDSVAPRVNYATLDRDSNEVRIRLSSTVLKVVHNGDPGTANDVSVIYIKDGKAMKVTAGSVVMGCFNAIVPHLCPEMNEVQKNALHMSVRMPMVATNVVLRNWQAHVKLGVSNIYYPSGPHNRVGLDHGASIGAYRRSPTPDEPTYVNMRLAPMEPDTGLNARDQLRAGRARLLAMPYADIERGARRQLARALSAGGFDPARDIVGVFVNRWGHAYASCANDLFDPEWTREELPWVVGRKRFGRIAIANSDAGAYCLTQAAFEQAHRAVTELIADVVRPSYGYPWGERV